MIIRGLENIGPGWLLLLQFNDTKSTETAEFERISVLKSIKEVIFWKFLRENFFFFFYKFLHEQTINLTYNYVSIYTSLLRNTIKWSKKKIGTHPA